ncbi:hypothetical protein [Egicoccus sp. AB-alg2]|uniref:hypothetical protein n=1 Tax=Egicoccus sp. AB-alg2 TaxID=3242693 RepID=UPI00359E8ED3
MTTLRPPDDRQPGFKPDPLTDGRYRRWWSGSAWGHATRPVGGPTLHLVDHEGAAEVAAGATAPFAPIVHRSTAALILGLLGALFGFSVLRGAVLDLGTPPEQLVFGWGLTLAGLVGVQAGVVGFVVGGLAREAPTAPLPEPGGG